MKLFLPKQHGAWAMLFIPFWLGVVASEFVWQHIPFFIGWMFLYLATYPMLLLFKRKKLPFYTKWTLIYFIPALALLIIPLLSRPAVIYYGLAMVPFFLISAYYSYKNRDRALLNDFSAIFVFSIAGLASSFLPKGAVTDRSLLMFTSSVLFFAGSTFYIKTMIREKKNSLYKWISWSYHLFVPIIWFVLGNWLVALAFLPSLGRAVAFYGKPYSIKKLGILEIINAALFCMIMLLSALAD